MSKARRKAITKCTSWNTKARWKANWKIIICLYIIMIKNNIPESWHVSTLNEIGEIVSGGTPSTKVAEYWNGDISWISPSDLSSYSNKTIQRGRKSITESGLKNSSARIIPKGSILFSSRAPIGYVVIAGNDVCTNQGFKSIIPNKSIFNEYLYYFLKASKHEAEKVASGTTFKEISLKAFAQLEIPIPPLPEQQAIVSKIEELFSDLDNGIGQLQKAQQQLKTYRQSLLKWAFEGRLTNKEVKEGELPDGWKIVDLKDVGRIVSGFAFKSTDFVPTGIPVVKISNIGYSEFVWKDQQFLPQKYLKSNAEVVIRSGDLLIALTRPITNNTTKVCQYPPTTNEALLNQRVACIKELKVNKNFLFLFFQTILFKEYIRSKFSETLQPNLSPKDLALAQIPICSFQEQQLIVDELESKLTVCDKLEETLTQSLQQAESLRQSIMKKAFEGKLV